MAGELARRNSPSPRAGDLRSGAIRLVALSPPLHAHKRVVDRARLIEPVTCIAMRRFSPRGPPVGIERELVMSHRDLVTLPALWLDGRVRDGLRGCWRHGRPACDQSNDRYECCDAFHCVQPSAAPFNGSLAEDAARIVHALVSEHEFAQRKFQAGAGSRMALMRMFRHRQHSVGLAEIGMRAAASSPLSDQVRAAVGPHGSTCNPLGESRRRRRRTHRPWRRQAPREAIF